MGILRRLARLIGIGVSAGLSGSVPTVVRPEPAPLREMAPQFDSSGSGMIWERRAIVATPEEIQAAYAAAEEHWAVEFAGWDPKEGRKRMSEEWKRRYPNGLEFVPYTEEDFADWG